MKQTRSIYYFTMQDPDYVIKGSRDPLGLQVLWQSQAKKLIPYLSTVCGNLRDFQTMCLAYHLYGQESDQLFPKLFLRFEQVMAYVRYQFLNDTRFNGINRVRKKINDSTKVSISNEPADEILSNQRAYGIWGKYNRPFNDMRLIQEPNFHEIFKMKLDELQEAQLEKLIKKLRKSEGFKVDVSEFEFLSPLFDIKARERKMYEEKILKINSANPYQNNLFDFLSLDKEAGSASFYTLLENFKTSVFSADLQLQQIITDIRETEKLLSPLGRVFSYLQTKPLWTLSEINSDPFISKCKTATGYTFLADSEQNKTKNNFAISMQKSNWDFVVDLVKRNAEVSNWRKGTAWVTIAGDILEVHHNEGALLREEYEPSLDNDNFYFIDTYLALHTQIHA